MIGERIRDVAVIHSTMHNFYVTHSLKYIERTIGERIRDVVVIHSAIHNFYVTHQLKYRENDWRTNKRCGGYS